MDQTTRVAAADETWAACEKLLPLEVSSLIAVVGGGAKPFDKHSKGSARLRIQPREKIPSRFWVGWQWYEIFVGMIPGRTFIGEVGFIFGGSEKGGKNAPYAMAVKDLARFAVPTLGGNFAFHPPPVMAIANAYKGPAFPVGQAASDLARLIEFTLPRILALRPEI